MEVIHPAILEFKRQYSSTHQPQCIQAATLVGIALLKSRQLPAAELFTLADHLLDSSKPLLVLAQALKQPRISNPRPKVVRKKESIPKHPKRSTSSKQMTIRRSSSHKKTAKLSSRESSAENCIVRVSSQKKPGGLKQAEWNMQLYGSENQHLVPIVDYFSVPIKKQSSFLNKVKDEGRSRAGERLSGWIHKHCDAQPEKRDRTLENKENLQTKGSQPLIRGTTIFTDL